MLLKWFKGLWLKLYCRFKHKGLHKWSYAYEMRQWRKSRKRGKAMHHRYEFKLHCDCCGHKTKWLRWKHFDEVYHRYDD